jgi:hypothetical protein
MSQEEEFNIFLDTWDKRALPMNLDFLKSLSVLKPA